MDRIVHKKIKINKKHFLTLISSVSNDIYNSKLFIENGENKNEIKYNTNKHIYLSYLYKPFILLYYIFISRAGQLSLVKDAWRAFFFRVWWAPSPNLCNVEENGPVRDCTHKRKKNEPIFKVIKTIHYN